MASHPFATFVTALPTLAFVPEVKFKPTSADPILTMMEAAKELGMSCKKLRRLADEGHIKRVPGTTSFRLSTIKAYGVEKKNP